MLLATLIFYLLSLLTYGTRVRVLNRRLGEQWETKNGSVWGEPGEKYQDDPGCKERNSDFVDISLFGVIMFPKSIGVIDTFFVVDFGALPKQPHQRGKSFTPARSSLLSSLLLRSSNLRDNAGQLPLGIREIWSP